MAFYWGDVSQISFDGEHSITKFEVFPDQTRAIALGRRQGFQGIRPFPPVMPSYTLTP